MFQGSENVGKNEHGRYVDNAGGQWNASTGKDRTNYYETIPSHYLELALWLEADRMEGPSTSLLKILKTKEKYGHRKKRNKPTTIALTVWQPSDLKNSLTPIGPMDTLLLEKSRILKNALCKMPSTSITLFMVLVMQFWYSLAICRKLTYWRRSESIFSDISDHTERQNPYLEEPRQVAKKSETIQDPLATLPAIYMGYHMPELGSPEYYALSMLALILSQGESSRFYRQFIHDNNWVTSFSVGPNQNKGPELFYIWAQVQSGIDVDRVIQAIEKELSDLGKMPITEGELEKARNQTTDRFVGRLTKIAHIGELLAHYALFFENANKINSDLDRYLAVTQEDILKVAQHVFCPENQTLIIVEPAPITTSP